MRVFLVVSAVLVMLFVAVAVCIEGPVETCPGIALHLEDSATGVEQSEHRACARCSESHTHDYLNRCTRKATAASIAGAALKLPSVAAETRRGIHEDTSLEVQVLYVGVRV